jgi:guanidinoacetate N-methyltransferase
MQSWERPIMAAMAREVTNARVNGDVLEIGFGMGICASEIAKRGCNSYTVIEAHPKIAAAARAWGHEQPFPVRVCEGLWQQVIDGVGQRFDGIVFDTFPLNASERGRNHFPFIPKAPALLRPGGVLTLFSDETTEFRSEHLSLLLASFSEIRLLRLDGLEPPPDCEYWSSSTMTIPVCVHRPESAGELSCGSGKPTDVTDLDHL